MSGNPSFFNDMGMAPQHPVRGSPEHLLDQQVPLLDQQVPLFDQQVSLLDQQVPFRWSPDGYVVGSFQGRFVRLNTTTGEFEPFDGHGTNALLQPTLAVPPAVGWEDRFLPSGSDLRYSTPQSGHNLRNLSEASSSLLGSGSSNRGSQTNFSNAVVSPLMANVHSSAPCANIPRSTSNSGGPNQPSADAFGLINAPQTPNSRHRATVQSHGNPFRGPDTSEGGFSNSTISIGSHRIGNQKQHAGSHSNACPLKMDNWRARPLQLPIGSGRTGISGDHDFRKPSKGQAVPNAGTGQLSSNPGSGCLDRDTRHCCTVSSSTSTVPSSARFQDFGIGGGYRPMNAVNRTGKVNHANDPQAFLKEINGISPNYAGDASIARNRSADIPDSKNCSFWVTNLPAAVNHRQLLGEIRNVGRVSQSVINPASDGHTGCAAKVIFFELEAANRFYEMSKNPAQGFILGGRRAKVIKNRIKTAEEDVGGHKSRVLRVQGESGFVNRDSLLNYWRSAIRFEIDEIIVHHETNIMGDIEFRFGSWSNQASAARTKLIVDGKHNRNDPSAPVWDVHYGPDPCA